MNRPLRVLLAVVGTFAVLGAGIGLASNFTLGFYIEQFVEPGQDPFDLVQVAIIFLVAIFLTYVLGPISAGIAGIGVGRTFPNRQATAGVIAGLGSFVGLYLLVGLSLFLTFLVLPEYGVPLGGEGGDGGGDSPLDPAGLLTLMVQVSLPVALVGFTVAYLTSSVAEEAETKRSVAEDSIVKDVTAADGGSNDSQ